jgi:hyperosmotically inducible protein
MRQIAAFLILAALFVVLVGSRFQPSDGDRLAAVSRLAVAKVRESLPPAERLAAPVHALRGGLPQRVEDRVRARLETDKALEGVAFAVSAEGGVVKLRGVVPDARARRRAVELAETTTGVEKVVDELAVPVDS